MRNDPAAADDHRPAGAGLREAVPDEYLASRELKIFGEGGVEVSRDRFPGDLHAQSPPLDGHVVDLHLSGPLRTARRLDGGRWLEGVELPGHFGHVHPAGVPFEVRAVEPSEDLNVLLDGGLVRRVAEEAGADPDGFEVLARFCVRDERMEWLTRSFLLELETGGLGGELYAQGLATTLAVHLLREHSSLGERAKRKAAGGPGRGGLSARQLKRVTDHIGDNLSGELSLAGMAGAANLSAYHFSRVFKRSTGLSPHQYVIRERVERAKGLLLRGDLSVAAVAREVGFSDQGHLSRHTRRLLGATPGEILREGRAEEGKNLRAQRKILQDRSHPAS